MILRDLLSKAPEREAIAAPGRLSLAYAGFGALVDRSVSSLNAAGLNRNDKVAIVLPNGPEMATCFVACASALTAAPLNPAYREDEFHFYMDDLKVRALIVEQGSTSPAISAAQRLGTPVLTLVPGKRAGEFTLEGNAGSPTSRGGLADVEDVALVLHTSGTTSRPKIVPLTHTNLIASANNIGRTLELTDADRCLNIMPLFRGGKAHLVHGRANHAPSNSVARRP
jgi:acyl-CoA synthetase (AMP-forming)/AMP-acid ligase II